MSLKYLLLLTPYMLFGLSATVESFPKMITIAPNTKETIVIQTKIPVNFNAQFVDPNYHEAKKCGNCLHIETVMQNSNNTAASMFGVGFMSVSPESEKVIINVFHDYNSSKIIEINTGQLKTK